MRIVMKKDKSLTLGCNCIGGKKLCGYLRAYDYNDNDVDITIYNETGKKKKIKAGIYLDKKSIEKLIQFLTNIICK